MKLDGLEAIYGPTPRPTAVRFDAKVLIEYMSPMTLRAVARQLQVDPAVLCRPLSSGQADRFATRLGVHPAEVWGAAWLRPEDQRATCPPTDRTSNSRR